MGLLRQLFGRTDKRSEIDAAAADDRSGVDVEKHMPKRSVTVSVSTTVGVSLEAPIQLSGTTTKYKQGTASVARRYGLGDRGHMEIAGTLHPSPVHPGSADIAIGDTVIGWISYVTEYLETVSDGHSVPVQLFTEVLPAGLRAEAWVWLGSTPPRWEWSNVNRPPMSSQAKALDRQRSTDQMVQQALAEGGSRARSIQNGIVDGTHYLQLVEPIKHAKREGRLEDALAMCYQAIHGAERAREGRDPAPWYTEQAAIIHRKLGQRDAEIAVLTRWLSFVPKGRRESTRLGDRLAKLTGG